MTSAAVQQKLEDLERKRLKKKECETKALHVVERLLDDTISADFLQDALQFLSTSHYNDVTVERALDNLCGYPLCSQSIDMKLKQKYKIDTRSNKVYDVTDRKNFCSNGCFRASRYLEAQISKLPVWARDGEAEIRFKFMEPCGKKGFVGDLVLDNPASALSSELDQISLEENIEVQRSSDHASANQKQVRNLTDDSLVENRAQNAMTSSDCDVESENANVGDRTSELDSDDDDVPENRDVNEEYGRADTLRVSQKQQQTLDNLMELIDKRDKLIKQLRAEKCQMKTDDVRKSEKSGPCEDKQRDSDSVKPESELDCVAQQRFVDLSSCSQTVNNEQLVKSRPIVSAREKVEKFLSEWMSYESMNSGRENRLNRAEVQEKLVAKLKREEILSRAADLEEPPDSPAGAMPSYQELREKQAEFEIKVRQFYSGAKIAPTVTDKNDDVIQERASDWSPVVPLIDSQSQMTIRRRIVFNAINRNLPSILILLRLRNDDVCDDLKKLIYAVNLTSGNIVLKQNEWSLMAVYILKFLSRSNDVINSAFELRHTDVDDVISMYDVTCEDIDEWLNKLTS